MGSINRIAVVGSGVMGAGIAASIANAGFPVWLYDIVPDGAEDRDVLSKKAIENMHSNGMLTHPSNASRITPVNLEDDMLLMMDMDWIIEVIIEKMELKHKLYKKIEEVRKPESIISSNTSTIPLEDLIDGRSDSFKKHFLVTHFFNPPRYMPLLEVVSGEDTLPEITNNMHEFLDVHLGKGVVVCKDTPGFIANRIGCFWLEVGLNTAINMKMRVEDVDAIIGKSFGFPKTGILGLYDLIGVDLMPMICKSLLENVPWEDPFHEYFKDYPLIEHMIKKGLLGRKSKSGFYKLTKLPDGGRQMEVMDLERMEYRPEAKEEIPLLESSPRDIISSMDDAGRYAWVVLSRTMHYAALLIPEISDNIFGVDKAMRLGYNWKYGPFELMDLLGKEGESGPAWLANRFAEEGVDIPPILEIVAKNNERFYKTENGKRLMANLQGKYEPIPEDPAHQGVSQMKTGAVLLENEDAALWDIGDGVACFEIKTKLNILTENVFTLLKAAVAHAEEHCEAMVIASDQPHFSAGANLRQMLASAEASNWGEIESYIKLGQSAMQAVKYAKIPVVSAASGVALGGGCELLLHSHAVVAHAELSAGLVETRVGLIPGWGGCKEMLLKTFESKDHAEDFTNNFMRLVQGQASSSAQEAKESLFTHHDMTIIMNRERLLSAAKEKAKSLALRFVRRAPKSLQKPDAAWVEAAMSQMQGAADLTTFDKEIGTHVMNVMSANNNDSPSEEGILSLELSNFLELVKKKDTLARIEHMISTGKALHN